MLLEKECSIKCDTKVDWMWVVFLAFLLALAMAKRLGELQALSSRVTAHDPALSLASLPKFVAKIESEGPPLPQSFLVWSLEEFVGDLLFCVLYELFGLIYPSCLPSLLVLVCCLFLLAVPLVLFQRTLCRSYGR